MSDHAAEAYAIAWALYHAEMADYEPAPDEFEGSWAEAVEREWMNNGTREVWLHRAQVALDAQAKHRLSGVN